MCLVFLTQSILSLVSSSCRNLVESWTRCWSHFPEDHWETLPIQGRAGLKSGRYRRWYRLCRRWRAGHSALKSSPCQPPWGILDLGFDKAPLSFLLLLVLPLLLLFSMPSNPHQQKREELKETLRKDNYWKTTLHQIKDQWKITGWSKNMQTNGILVVALPPSYLSIPLNFINHGNIDISICVLISNDLCTDISIE